MPTKYRIFYNDRPDARVFDDFRQAAIAAFMEARNMSYEEARRNAVRYMTLGLIEKGVPANIGYGTQNDIYVTITEE